MNNDEKTVKLLEEIRDNQTRQIKISEEMHEIAKAQRTELMDKSSQADNMINHHKKVAKFILVLGVLLIVLFVLKLLLKV